MSRRVYESDTARVQAWRRRNPGFGLSEADLEFLHKQQDYRCAICGRAPKAHGRRLAIDHDHRTGIVRGLLCYRCNTAIGLLGDDAETVYRAARYLDGDR